MGAPLPKQYLPLAGATVLAWSLRALLSATWIARVLAVTAPGDARTGAACAALPADLRARLRVAAVGGATRRDSVLAGLDALRGGAVSHRVADDGALRPVVDDDAPRDDDWALVHDAARPGLTPAALERLRRALAGHAVGGLLALPVADTVKRARGPGAGDATGARAPGTVEATVPRDGLWLAQTPQAFRYGALRAALARHRDVTDEASAIEADGGSPLLVEGERRNFKITTAEDLALMRQLFAGAGLAERGNEETT